MIILPAIDIKDGNCVRLLKGEFNTVHTVAKSPLDAAMMWKNLGAEYLHIVDLDGSLQKKPVNNMYIESIIKNTGLPLEIGGGIRTEKDVETYLSMGADRLILGSAAINNPKFVKKMLIKYPNNIAIGIDAKDDFVNVDGWLDASKINYIDLSKEMVYAGAKYIIFTDISRDGTLQGASTEKLTALKNAVNVNIIASGGIRDIEDIKALRKGDFYGAICGKSLYSQTLEIREAIKIAKR